MDDARGVRGRQGRADLLDDVGHQRRGQGTRARGEQLERLALRPFERQEVGPVLLAVLPGPDHVGVHHAHPELRLAQEALDGDRVLRDPGAEDLDGGGAPLGVLGLVDHGGAALTDVLDEAVAGHRAADEIVWRHEREEATRRRRGLQAGGAPALDPASAQGITFARPSRADILPVPEGGLVFRPRLTLLLLLSVAACSSWQRVGDSSTPSPEETLTSLFDMPAVYRTMGRLAAGPPLPFVGTVAFAAGPGDSVKAILGLSIENRALSFQKDGANFVAHYRVEMFLESSNAPPIRFARDEEVRVSRFRGDDAQRRERALPAAVSPEGRGLPRDGVGAGSRVLTADPVGRRLRGARLQRPARSARRSWRTR